VGDQPQDSIQLLEESLLKDEQCAIDDLTLKKYHRKDRNVIITGIPRSGTSLLSVIINGFDNAVCLNEILYDVGSLPKAFSLVRKKLITGEGVPNKFDEKGYLTTDTQNGSVILKNIVIQNVDENILIGSKVNIPYLDQLPFLLTYGYKTICLIRDPVYTIGSWCSSKASEIPEAKVTDDNMHPRWRHFNFRTKDRIERMVQIWSHYAQLLWNYRSKLKILTYESLVLEHKREIEKLARFLEIENPPSNINLKNGNIRSKYPEIEKIIKKVNLFCPIKHKFKYEDHDTKTSVSFQKPNSKRKIAFFAGDGDNFHFIHPIIDRLKTSGFETRIVKSNALSQEGLFNHMKWSDVSWFEWANGPIIEASRMPKKCKIICRLHRYEVYSDTPKNINWGSVDHLIFVSPIILDVFKEFHYKDIDKRTNVQMIPNAVDLNNFQFNQRKKGFNIAYIARINSVKNPALMVQIISELIRRDPRFKCYMIGRIQEVPQFQYICHLIKKLGLQDSIIYEGISNDVDKWLNDKHFILSTSIIESQGLGIMEGMAKGLKPVIHNFFGMPDLVFDRKYVFDTVEQAVEMFLSNDYNPQEYRNLIEQRYSLDEHVENIKKIILADNPLLSPSITHSSLNFQLKESAERLIPKISPVNKPTVSVIVPLYNAAAFIAETLQSVVNQSYQDWEIIVVNDGCTDNSIEIVRKFIRKNSERSIYIIEQKNQGETAARNRGIGECRGKYVLPLDADDKIHPHMLEKCVRVLEESSDISIVYTDVQEFGDKHRMVPAAEYSLSTLCKFNYIVSCALFRKEVWEKARGYNANMKDCYEDWDFWICAGEKGFVGKRIPEALFYYRKRNNSGYSRSLERDKEAKARIITNHQKLFSEKQINWAQCVLNGDSTALRLKLPPGLMPVFSNDRFEPKISLPSKNAKYRAPGTLPSSQKLSILFFMYGWLEEGGGTILPRQIARAFARRGHRMTVVYSASQNLPDKPPYYTKESEEAGVRLIGIYNRPAILCDLQHPEREIEDATVRKIIAGIIDETKPDIVHHHNLVTLSMSVAEEVRRRGIPSVYTSHNYWLLCPRLYLFQQNLSLCDGPSPDGSKCAVCTGQQNKQFEYAKRIEQGHKLIHCNTDRHLAVSQRLRELFIKNGHSADRIHVLQQQPETVDDIWRQVGSARAIASYAHRPIKIGFIGSLLPQKGVHILLDSMKSLREIDVECHIFGNGPESYLEFLRKQDTDGFIRFHGRYETIQLPDILKESDIIVVPSIWEDCAPLVVAEALAARCLVIGSRIGGIPDFIEDQVNGFLFEPGNSEDLHQILTRIIYDHGLLGKLQSNIKQPKGFDAYLDELVDHYSDVIIEQKQRLPGAKVNFTPSLIPERKILMTEKTSSANHSCPNKIKQKFSLYHVEGREAVLKSWMVPYADEFIGCENVLDIGCGPGLFLELLNERGISCIGFDYDAEMVAICKGKGLNARVVNGNALSGYSEQFDGIHLGHIIEHMDGEAMVKLLEACVAALRPGGLLLIRTPNWQNETVRSGGFWLDHTHVRPYPLELLDQIYQDLGLDMIRKGYEPGGWNDIYILGKRPALQEQRPSPEFEDTANRVCRPEVMTVRWEGSQLVNHSLALVNRELCIELARRQDIELSLIPYEPHEFGPEADPERFGLIEERLRKPLSGAADFHVRHQWPPNFTPPPEGHWIIIQPWEFGALPKSWVEPMETLVDELWVPSNHVRDVYIMSGITPDKVFVVPNGVNHNQFNPEAEKLELSTNRRFKFLFVGGTIMRKGVDVLLSAYGEAFTAEDDVCLVIKDMGGESFYRGQNASKIIEDIKRNPESPEILYLTETMNTDQIAGLYTACDCLVHPYRGEGFGLPVAEAMACGLPVIVTRGGACDDFCSDEAAYLIDSKVRPVQLDGYVLSAQGWLLEPDRAQLIDRLRFIYEHPSQAKEKGAIAARQIRKKVDWKMSTDLIIKRLRALRSKPVRRFAGSIDRKSTQASEAPQEIYQTIQQSMKNRKPEEVIAELEMLIESYPEFALAHNDLGVLYYTAGNKEKAHQFYEKAVQLEPDNTVFQKNLADFYFVELGRVEDALRVYIKVLEANPKDAETLLIAGHICVALHKFEDAGLFYKRVLELEPWNEEAQNNLNKLDKMNPIAPEPKLPQEMYQEIQPLLNNGDPNKAISALEELLQSYPDFALAHNDLGVLYYHSGDKEKTRDHYESATRLMPENINFQKNLADFYCIELGRIEDALKIYVSILKTDPQDIETLLATGLICKALEKLDDARDFFNRVLEIEPWNADAREHLEEMERQPSGENLNSESPEDAYRRLQQELNNLIPAEAIVELEKLVELHPNFAIGHNDLGVLYYNTGNKEKALHHYQQAAHLQPENMTLQKNLADFMFLEQGRVEEALKIYVNILATNPRDVETLLITGHICVALKKFDDAKKFYERVLTLEPDNEDASKNLQALIMSQRERSSATPDSITDVTASGAKIELTDLNPEKSEKRQDEPKTSVSIVISLEGIQNRVEECLKSIQIHTAEPHELLLVDRGATRGMLKWARQLVKDKDHYHIIECGRQVGWAESINQAIQKASGDIVVLIHNDVVVPEGWLTAFKMCLKLEPNIGVVGPISNRAAGIQQLMHSNEFDRIEFESAAKAFFEQNQYRRVAVRKLSDFCLAFRQELHHKIGYFDKQFFSEETGVEDFCNRAASGGYQNMIVADTYIYHYDRHPANKKAPTNNPVSNDDQKKFKEKWNGAQNPEAKAFPRALFLERANELSQKGQIDQAVEVLLNAIGIQPKEQRFYLELAQILLAAKRFQDAKDALMEIPYTDDYQQMRKAELLGYAEEGLENFDAARTYIEQVLAMNPDRAPALNLEGILAYRNNDRHSAEKYFQRAIASDPGYGEPYSNLGMLSLEAGRPQDALQFFEKAFRLIPTDMDIATNYHSLIAEIGEYSKAENLAREAIALYPNNQKIKYMLIDFLIQQGQYEMAMPEIEDAIIKFGFDDGILGASLKLREKLGPMTIKKSSKKAPVSLCMIIKDEEKYLARSLASVKPIVDEMILVDTGSADRSKDIAITFGAQVYDYDWENDFAAARNFSISKASGQWILILDGDEAISPLDYEHFNKIVSKKPKAPVAYSITTRNYSKLANFVGWVPNVGRYPDEEAAIGWMPSEKVRLFYGKDQIWFEGAVHELVDPVLKRNGIKIKKCSIPVHHYGRLDKKKLDRKGEIYFDIGQKKLAEMGGDINALRELAIQATILEKNQLALELWKKLLGLNPNPKLAALAYVNVGTIYNRLEKFDDALDAGQKAVANDPDLKEARYNLAMAELHCENAQNAISILEDLLGSFSDYPPAQFILSAACCCAGQQEKGHDGIRKLKNTPLGAHLEMPCIELARSLLAAKKMEYALKVLGAAIECDIVNKEILDLFTACIEMNDKAQKSQEIPLRGLMDRQPIKFENLPQ
jgi:glycosyltransferase involved in cell wall biosynthesis/tetratricopeptide (TPR) repeat protein/GT2 family glycosyltransferase